MDVTKIQLSPTEMGLVSNADIILTKNKILQKAFDLLQMTQEELQHFVKENDLQQQEIFKVQPKISKGENYSGLPYLILDYPRIFSNQNIFAVRSMFWWGNFFSTTLHISGSYKAVLEERIFDNYDFFAANEYFLGVNEDPWVHHFEENNYLPIKNLSKENFIGRCSLSPQIKIATKWPLSNWTSVANNIIESWKKFIDLLITT